MKNKRIVYELRARIWSENSSELTVIMFFSNIMNRFSRESIIVRYFVAGLTKRSFFFLNIFSRVVVLHYFYGCMFVYTNDLKGYVPDKSRKKEAGSCNYCSNFFGEI